MIAWIRRVGEGEESSRTTDEIRFFGIDDGSKRTIPKQPAG
jgi:hypothetical protein